jgi:hypothetical protein
MKVKCCRSNLVFRCDYFPAFIHAPEVYHPIFNLPLKKLISFYPRILSSAVKESNLEDAYLYTLALLSSTGHINFNCPAELTAKTQRIIVSNLEQLLITVTKLDAVSHPGFKYPNISINKETSDLAALPNWLLAWREALDFFTDYQASARFREEVKRRDEVILYLLKNKNLYQTNKSRYAEMVADWTAVAGDFPEFKISHPLNPLKQITLRNYWRELIIKSVEADEISLYPAKDFTELLDHCIENLPFYADLSLEVIKLLKPAENKVGTLFDFPSTQFILLDEDDPVQSQTKARILVEAPENKPQRSDYSSPGAYLKALLSWQFKNNAGNKQS